MKKSGPQLSPQKRSLFWKKENDNDGQRSGKRIRNMGGRCVRKVSDPCTGAV